VADLRTSKVAKAADQMRNDVPRHFQQFEKASSSARCEILPKISLMSIATAGSIAARV
jgi:hypothetical protein